jgi:hypothetical protein
MKMLILPLTQNYTVFTQPKMTSFWALFIFIFLKKKIEKSKKKGVAEATPMASLGVAGPPPKGQKKKKT